MLRREDTLGLGPDPDPSLRLVTMALSALVPRCDAMAKHVMLAYARLPHCASVYLTSSFGLKPDVLASENQMFWQ